MFRTKSLLCARIGSPFTSRGAVMTFEYVYCTISTLLDGKTGESGGTKAMPSAPPMPFTRRVADVILNVPLPSGANSQWNQPLAPNEAIFMLPAPGNPGGTKAIEPPELGMPSGVMSVILSGATLPGLLCSTSLRG